MTKTTIKMVLMLGVLAVLIVSAAGCTSPATPSPSPSPSFHGMLVEHPASASGPDLSVQINTNTASPGSGLTYYRVTINGHDAYAAHNASAATTDAYVFPSSNYSDAKALQASYVAEFQAHGFNVSSVAQNPWGPNSILTALKSGSISISAADSATVRPGTNILNGGSEVVIFISP
jgi:hypothetical protein